MKRSALPFGRGVQGRERGPLATPVTTEDVAHRGQREAQPMRGPRAAQPLPW